MQFDSESKKKPYSPPTVTKLTLEQAKQFDLPPIFSPPIMRLSPGLSFRTWSL